MTRPNTVPVALFCYTRREPLRKTLDALRACDVPLIYAFSDGPATPERAPAVAEVRCLLRAIDWCEVVLVEREQNLGLGRSILAGVGSVLEIHDSVIVFEDDLVCVPGTYRYLTAAMDAYRDDPRVLSVTAWTHPKVTPSGVVDQPYFDGRAECWVWGTWARVWPGMASDARSLMRACRASGKSVYRYGADLPAAARLERQKNIWAVRFLYLHMLHEGLCLRPPYSMVTHIGFDAAATNASHDERWQEASPSRCPPIPCIWPEATENPECPGLWQAVYGARPAPRSMVVRAKHAIKQAVRLGQRALRR